MSNMLVVGQPERKWVLDESEDAERLAETLAACARDGVAVDFKTDDGTTIWLNPSRLAWWYVTEYVMPTIY